MTTSVRTLIKKNLEAIDWNMDRLTEATDGGHKPDPEYIADILRQNDRRIDALSRLVPPPKGGMGTW